jgi:hypothetical protein
MTPRPNPTPVEQRARPCPLCEDDEYAFGNICRLYQRPAYIEHCRTIHPGLDGSVLWKFPMPNKRANG